MNADDRGRNLAEARHFRASQAAAHRPAHGGYADPRCACAGTGWVLVEGVTARCPSPDHVLAPSVPMPRVSDPRGLPDVEWETVAGHALRDLQALGKLYRGTLNELKRLRSEMPTDAVREYDRRHHS